MERKNKRAQVTIFIIISVIVVALVILFFTFKDKIITKETDSPEILSIRNFVEQCIKETGEDVIFTVGQGGGYYFPPELSTDSGIAYYLKNNKNYMPTKDKIEREISYYTKEKIFLCTKDFIDFPEYEIRQGEINVKTEIKDEKIIFNVEYPLAIKKANETSRTKDFKIEIPIRFGVIYNVVDRIMQEQLNHTDSICLSCILNASTENEFYIDMLDYDNETTIFVLTDEDSKINQESFEFIFANKYKIK